MKADLHMHGLIGFHPYWIKTQGYERKNLLKEIADSCFEKDLDFCAITSSADKISENSINDRLGYLTKFISSLPKEYKADKLGKNVIIVEKNGKRVYLLNSQTVIVSEKGRKINHLVVGSNKVPNFMSLRDTIEFGKDNGLIQIAEHPLCKNDGGMGKKLLEEYIQEYTAVEGHNSEMIFPYPLFLVPYVHSFTKMANRMTQKIAKKHGKSWIATSNAHWIKNAGLSYIEFSKKINVDNDETILNDLKEIIIFGKFKNVCNYESCVDWVKWVSKFVTGVKFHRGEVKWPLI